MARTRAQKAEIVGRSEVIGIRPAAREANVPESTLRTWRESPEFAQLRAQKKEDVALDVFAAFQKGVQRVSVLLATTEDLAKVAVATGILYDKFALMSGSATSRSETKALTDDLDDTERARLRDWIDGLAAAEAPESAPI